METGEERAVLRKALARLIEQHRPWLQDLGAAEEALDEPCRYALIEESRGSTAGVWISTHDTPEEAAAYHDDQEYSDDWGVVELRDLLTGRTFEAVRHTSWVLGLAESGERCAGCHPYGCAWDCGCRCHIVRDEVQP